MGKFFSKIGSWFKAFFTKHNMFALLVTVERAGKVAGDVTTGNIPAAVTDAADVVSAAESIKVTESSASAATSSAPVTK